MKTRTNVGGQVGGRVRLATFRAADREQFRAGKKCVPIRATGWVKNLVLDQGLNQLAGAAGYANIFNVVSVGSGTNPTEFNFSGSAIFTQVGTTITSSGGSVFTSAMIGGIFKYGATGVSGGAEQYITAVTGATATVAGSGMTVSTPTAGAVWQVQATGLQTFLANNASYVTTAGSITNAFTGSTWTGLRTYQFATPSSTWSVNEVGYSQNTGNTGICGRIVLPSTVTVTTSEFLVLQLEMTVTQLINSPTAVANVGTSFNTAGTAMNQVWNIRALNTTTGGSITINSGTGSPSTPCSFLDGQPGGFYFVETTAFSLNSSISNSAAAQITVGALQSFSSNNVSNSGQAVGVGVLPAPVSFSFSTSGQSVVALAFGQGNGITPCCSFAQNLTTAVTLPTGTFSGTWNYSCQFTRQLTN